MNPRLRAAGIWLSDAHILLESLVEREVWGVPGGFVEEGESVERACVREYLEETGLSLNCDRLAIVHEFFWNHSGQLIREYGFYFVVSPTKTIGEQPAVSSREGHLQFRWHPLSNLNEIEFVPEVLRGYLLNLPDDTLFVSTREEGV